LRTLAPAALLLAAQIVAACDPVAVDDARNDKRLFLPRGVIRGTVTYTGPRPCSRNGHIAGGAAILVFDRRNPPPPAGFAQQPVNFVTVPGDVLFANEPRSTGDALFCPGDEVVTVSAPFTVSPLEGGAYVIAAFYDRAGRFLPGFKFRNLPEAGDLGGGFIDLADAQKNLGNPSYTPAYLPVTVGLPQEDADGRTTYTVPPQTGWVADDIPVTIGATLRTTRPYFHVRDADRASESASTAANPKGTAEYVPVLTMTQDHKILAPPRTPTASTIDAYEKGFRAAKIVWGVPPGELAEATDPKKPYGLQISAPPPSGSGGLFVWTRGGSIPESAGVAALWPLVAFSKLVDDPSHALDPQSLVPQSSRDLPIVVIQGITLNNDALAQTTATLAPAAPAANALRAGLTALIRPAALCVSSRRPDLPATLVTPHTDGKSADPAETGEKKLFDLAAVQRSLPPGTLVKQGCLPLGRYAISLVYPSGQAWTVPNEAGSCAPAEGAMTPERTSCSAKPRPVLPSQGNRAVLEIVPPGAPGFCDDHPVPPECLRNSP
jgi:hypothetical protein